ncbi:unnamed protein product [Linum trigynum]|uniref:Uncharacterized protein n=1 Tax=Linum trigynum TaxID=586398 RepID=A0AAV2G8E0_9ROSI
MASWLGLGWRVLKIEDLPGFIAGRPIFDGFAWVVVRGVVDRRWRGLGWVFLCSLPFSGVLLDLKATGGTGLGVSSVRRWCL